MRKVAIAVCLAAIFAAFPVAAYAREMGRHHTISIEVECIEAAREVINSLNGHNLHSNLELAQRGWRNAQITRVVDEWAFRHVQEVLRGLGEVTSESENAWHLGGAILETETRITVLNREIERLTAMLVASDSLEVLIAVNDRLSWVSRDRDGQIGRRNLLISQVNSPVIDIFLSEPPAYVPAPPPDTFGERVAHRFRMSLQNTRRVTGNALVFFARASLQIVFLAAVGGAATVAVLKIRKKRRLKEANHETE